MAELLIGCGSRRARLIGNVDGDAPAWGHLTTLDNNPDHNPDVVWDLESLPLPFDDESFDEIHAYEVLEHTGSQGDYRFFFAQFADFWRLLKPGGLLCGTCPSFGSRWMWGDPSHKRVIMPENFTFLEQGQYIEQIGKTAMSDFRYIYKADFRFVFRNDQSADTFAFALQAVKPSRWRAP